MSNGRSTAPPDRWIEFLSPYIGTDKARDLVGECQAHDGAKEALYNAKRLITLSSEMDEFRPGRAPLQLLFLLTCAEDLARRTRDSLHKHESRNAVILFFRRFADRGDLKTLSTQTICDKGVKRWEDVIHSLYEARNEVAHKGIYWQCAFADAQHFQAATVRIAPMSMEDFRGIVVRATVRALGHILKTIPNSP